MKDEDKNKDDTQNDMSNKRDIIESEPNNNFGEKTSDDIHNINHPNMKLNERKLEIETNNELKSKDAFNQKNTDEIISKQSYYDKINRYLKFRRKKILLIILLSIGSIFLIISIIDIVNSNQIIYDGKKILNNNIIIFTLQIIYIFSLFIFQILTLISKRKDNLKINLIFFVIICFLMTTKIILFVRKNDKNSIIMLNFLISFFLFIINLIIFFITLRTFKIKKNEKQNIEEIINFSDIPQGTTKIKINDKKDNQIDFNNSGIDNKVTNDEHNNKNGISNLVDDDNNKEDNDKNEQK